MKRVQRTVRGIPELEWSAIHVHAALQGRSARELITDAIREYLDRHIGDVAAFLARHQEA